MIHKTAIVDSEAKISDNVEIGPYCIIGEDVEIMQNTKLHSHVVIKGPSLIGQNNIFYQFSTIGEDTPDKKFKGEKTKLEIGDNNIFREGVTVHRGTIQDNGITKIGSENLFMAYSHVAHDCVVGIGNVFGNNAGIAGINTTVTEYPIEEWNKIINLNLNSVFYCCKAVFPFMIKNNYGRIVNVASISGK